MAVNLEALESLIENIGKTADEQMKNKLLDNDLVTIKAIPKALPAGSIYADGIVLEIGARILFYAACTYRIPAVALEASYFESANNPRFTLLHKFISSLEGNEVEIDAINYPTRNTSFAYWDGDWKGERQNRLAHGEYYTQNIYPTLLEVMEARLDSVPIDENIQFVDLFGGDGEFVKLLKARMVEKHRINSAYHIIDVSISSLDKAKKACKNDAAVIVHDPYCLEPGKPVFPELVMPPNFVTAIGGLYAGVVSRQEALGIATQVYEEIAEGGMFFVTGLSWSLLNAADFSKMGFKVLQMTKPENVVYFNPPYQLYVLQK